MRNSQLDISSRMERHPTPHTPPWPKFRPFFRQPRNFEGTLATALARSDAAWAYLKGRVHRNKPQTTDALKSNITEEIQAVTSDVLARTFPKYGAPGSILSGRKLWPLPAYVMMSSHFVHNEVSPLQISLQYPH